MRRDGFRIAVSGTRTVFADSDDPTSMLSPIAAALAFKKSQLYGDRLKREARPTRKRATKSNAAGVTAEKFISK